MQVYKKMAFSQFSLDTVFSLAFYPFHLLYSNFLAMLAVPFRTQVLPDSLKAPFVNKWSNSRELNPQNSQSQNFLYQWQQDAVGKKKTFWKKVISWRPQVLVGKTSSNLLSRLGNMGTWSDSFLGCWRAKRLILSTEEGSIETD